ncbi:MAG TPA: DNA-formamidopyrimidine glycosylase family protein [Thermoanaerobaculia bacterium]|nr:DNA-formamidopyrimidine glycosylase family protein [Thermoanaerobaculia bacterium]
MPELPDVTLYVERLAPLVVGETLQGVRLASPFLLRSVEPPLAAELLPGDVAGTGG